ncbi:MBL fold metallo-hydrolase [Bacillus salipaludis]|uniref:MBL fold metallo-hydrolase n=1 Tax=Bacillus salipaludis TaxID=2547811 RepID=A0A4R5VTN2_9BACI|nr:MBL fold metallo-hydrolase [Bacillus salipaludis]TDK62377.1 MBL fold metallo-hydrolase [Bacillus salipaludis]
MINTFQNGETVTIEKIVFNGYRIGIPIPFPIKYVYCYLFKQQDGYVLIDVGYNNNRGKTAWEDAFRELHMEPGEIKTIYLTHFHPDHAGLAGWMHQLTGAPIFMHEIDAKMMEHVWGENSSQARNIKKMVIEHGTPQELAGEIEKQMDVLVHHVQPLPAIHTITDQVVFANREWKVIHTPGHSTGHICFFQEEERVLISGDHILEKITPNISVWPGASQTPLHDYINSLHRVADLQAKIAFTAHRRPIGNVNERIKELLQHHEERLESILALAQNRTAFEVAGDLFAHKELTPHQWRFAIAETIAHLDYLSIENRAEKIMGFPIKYEKSNE